MKNKYELSRKHLITYLVKYVNFSKQIWIKENKLQTRSQLNNISKDPSISLGEYKDKKVITVKKLLHATVDVDFR